MTKTALLAGSAAVGLASGLWLAPSASVAQVSAAATASAEGATAVGEVIVTAQKRSEKLKDVPVPVTVVKTDKLVSDNQVSLQDYYSTIPGLNLSTGLYGTFTLTVRGLNTDAGPPSVGTVIDDLSTGTGGWAWVPDFDPDDLAQVEILRGPQGTLYGSDSMGGLIKFVTKDPDPSAFAGTLSAGVSSVYNGSSPGYSARGSVNLPINDSMAIRVTGYDRFDPGYIDNTTYGVKSTNWVENDGGHLVFRWNINSDTYLKLSALYQQQRPNAPSEVTQGSGALGQNYLLPTRGFQANVGVYSINFGTMLGGVKIESITGYVLANRTGTLDWTNLFGTAFQSQFGASGALYSNNFRTSTATEELRFSGAAFSRLDWLAGAYYSNQLDQNAQIFRVLNASTFQTVAIDALDAYPDNYESTAAFANLTYHFNRQFDLQIGARFSHDIVHNQMSYGYGPFFVGAAPTSPATTAKSNTFTYLVAPSYKISSDLMVYARIATGFRPGVANNGITGGATSSDLPPGTVIPTQSMPDFTQNYEVGLKGDFFDRRLSIDASIYHVDWNAIQISVQAGAAFGYTTNGSAAKSDGVEFSTEWTPRQDLHLSGWVDFNNAVLTQSLPSTASVYALAGNRLPEGSRLSGNLSADQDFTLWGGARGSVGGSVAYIGDRIAAFSNVPFRQVFPAYAKLNLHSTVIYETWKFNLYANNVTDERGVIGTNSLVPGSLIYITPRTVGINVAKSF